MQKGLKILQEATDQAYDTLSRSGVRLVYRQFPLNFPHSSGYLTGKDGSFYIAEIMIAPPDARLLVNLMVRVPGGITASGLATAPRDMSVQCIDLGAEIAATEVAYKLAELWAYCNDTFWPRRKFGVIEISDAVLAWRREYGLLDLPEKI